MVAAVVFYVLASVAVLSSLLVITARNPVYSVLFLILSFFNVAGLFVLMGAEFLAMLLVIVYVGAVAVLFLFVVMMLNIDVARKESLGSWSQIGVAVIVAVVLVVELLMVLLTDVGSVPIAGGSVTDVENARAIGLVLYTDYIYVFQISGLILLVAMIGAIVLTHRRRADVLRQNVPEQLARDPKKAVVKVAVESGKGVKL